MKIEFDYAEDDPQAQAFADACRNDTPLRFGVPGHERLLRVMRVDVTCLGHVTRDVYGETRVAPSLRRAQMEMTVTAQDLGPAIQTNTVPSSDGDVMMTRTTLAGSFVPDPVDGFHANHGMRAAISANAVRKDSHADYLDAVKAGLERAGFVKIGEPQPTHVSAGSLLSYVQPQMYGEGYSQPGPSLAEWQEWLRGMPGYKAPGVITDFIKQWEAAVAQATAIPAHMLEQPAKAQEDTKAAPAGLTAMHPIGERWKGR